MKTIYVAADGKAFDKMDDAVKYERLLKEGAIERLKSNLATHLANKSKLKAGHLRHDTERLDDAWEEWQKAISACKNRFDFHSSDKCKAIYDALFHLETAAVKYHVDMRMLKSAKQDGPQIQEILKKVNASQREDDTSIPVDMFPKELLNEVKGVTWW